MREATSDPKRRQHLAALIGPVARTARSRLGLTQAEVAKQMGLASEVYSRLERGNMLPSVSTLHRLCEVLDVSPNELLGYTRAKPRDTDSPARRRLFYQVRQLDETRVRAILALLSAGKSHE
ncbi:helix-turn-helix transcriptional regulator [Myxococcus sp. MISCRS1]|uniref:helix-turn-helix domain-containing protein n=1 Tax=Myxococcus sp. MISCRS1 TaxID=2996786 RepID=UPI0022707744|nr:helix-turn-helix transcriptional regulator [Myxococcus sp. MISCRS1]MCY0997949.1 helix-turn-helix transcriptional regulator [Myxococcus sp. MISCRS1]